VVFNINSERIGIADESFQNSLFRAGAVSIVWGEAFFRSQVLSSANDECQACSLLLLALPVEALWTSTEA
jgi:hypothetical protein